MALERSICAQQARGCHKAKTSMPVLAKLHWLASVRGRWFQAASAAVSDVDRASPPRALRPAMRLGSSQLQVRCWSDFEQSMFRLFCCAHAAQHAQRPNDCTWPWNSRPAAGQRRGTARSRCSTEASHPSIVPAEARKHGRRLLLAQCSDSREPSPAGSGWALTIRERVVAGLAVLAERAGTEALLHLLGAALVLHKAGAGRQAARGARTRNALSGCSGATRGSARGGPSRGFGCRGGPAAGRGWNGGGGWGSWGARRSAPGSGATCCASRGGALAQGSKGLHAVGLDLTGQQGCCCIRLIAYRFVGGRCRNTGGFDCRARSATD